MSFRGPQALTEGVESKTGSRIISQWIKLRWFFGLCGTTQLVPFQNSIYLAIKIQKKSVMGIVPERGPTLERLSNRCQEQGISFAALVLAACDCSWA